MKKNENWRALKKFENTRVYFDSKDQNFYVTNFNDDIICYVPSLGRDFDFNKELAFCLAEGFESAFYEHDTYCENEKLFCFVCSHCSKCSIEKPHSRDCLITIENEEYFKDTNNEIAV